MPADITSILSSLQPKLADLAESTLSAYAVQAMHDGQQFLLVIRGDLARWTKQLETGNLTIRDFETLLIGNKDLAEMTALTEAGLAMARIDQFRMGMLKLVIDSVSAAVKI